jgi:protein-disulfide isomerase
VERYLPFAIVAAVLLIAAGAGTSLFFWKERAAQSQTASTKQLPIQSALRTDSSSGELPPGAEPPHIRGSANARVKIEEFGDFQCPSCAALRMALNEVEQKYHGKVCVIFRHFPLANHKHAQVAARAAEAAGLEDRFWEMHDFLYGSQIIWTRTADPRELFDQFAKSIGLDVERFKIDVESEQVKARITADQQRAASLGVNRTPAIFINGARLPDSSLNQKALEEAVEKAVNPKAR